MSTKATNKTSQEQPPSGESSDERDTKGDTQAVSSSINCESCDPS